VLTAAEVQIVFTNTIPLDGLVAEYRLEQDIVPDDVGQHNGLIFGGVWKPQSALEIAFSERQKCQSLEGG
jgi:hypothetical protein